MQPTSSNECMELEGIQENLCYVSLREFFLYNKEILPMAWNGPPKLDILIFGAQSAVLPPLVHFLFWLIFLNQNNSKPNIKHILWGLVSLQIIAHYCESSKPFFSL